MSVSLSYPFVLASASPRREELLRSLGLSFTILPAHIDETWQEGETPAAHVRRLAREKAAAMAVKHPQAIVLGADTIVALDGLILGKPKNRKQAREMLQRLSGRTHTVFTGFTLAQESRNVAKTRVVRSAVRFKVISPDEMGWYIASAEPYDKAGGYAAQGMGASFIKSIRGSYTNVIGLPVCEVLEELKKLDAVHFRGNKR
jgi:septum formation protein